MRTMLSVLLGCSLLTGPAQAEDAVVFADPNLKELVERELWLEDPTPTDMLQLTSLSAENSGIRDLAGLEYGTNLQMLVIRWNQISDLGPIAGLTNLRHLDAHANGNIRDLSPLAGLVNLETLIVRINDISDISPLAGLACLQELQIQCNSIADISPLAGLTELESLELSQNRISDISALASLPNLHNAVLRFNCISDISPLSGLTGLQELHLQANSISDVSGLAGLTGLRSLNLADNGISDISPLLALTNLDSLDLEGNFDLNEEAYRQDLWTIYDNGVSLRYSPSRARPAGVFASQGTCRDRIEVSWSEVHHGPLYLSYYRVYRAASASGTAIPVGGWQRSLRFDDLTAEPDIEYYYRVRAATSDQGANASDFGEVATGWLSRQPALVLTSTAGGSVVVPGEGVFPSNMTRTLVVRAESVDAHLYTFQRWSGSAVDAGRVSDPAGASVTVLVDGSYTLKAHFLARMDLLWVDDDAPGDPEPGDPDGSDPQEDGTAAHPLDDVQEAIEVAPEGATVAVLPGTYRGPIRLLGKGVELTGYDPEGKAMPVIDSAGTGPVVRFTDGESPNCKLIGFVLTGGRSPSAGAIACAGSSPVIANCLIVGNRAIDAQGAIVCSQQSHPALVNSTIADNVGDAVRLVDSHMVLTSSIVWANAPGPIVLNGQSGLALTYSNVSGGWPDLGNIDADPLFARRGYWADPANPQVPAGPDDADAVWMAGDYRLKSQAGRWDPRAAAWVRDNVTSPCIDAGSPTDPVGLEPPPHGGVINMGAYGGTAGASKSAVNP
ncbi:MAG: hypothetical protein JW993_15645 [Sedimentisphaerales bacterium]|nr:hypothetical protein [Sedimentisphaerales bacterium]